MSNCILIGQQFSEFTGSSSNLSTYKVLSNSTAANWWGGTSGTSTKTWSYSPTENFKMLIFVQSMTTGYGTNSSWNITHSNLNQDGITFYSGAGYSSNNRLNQAITIFFNAKIGQSYSLSSTYNGDRWQGTSSQQAIYGLN